MSTDGKNPGGSRKQAQSGFVNRVNKSSPPPKSQPQQQRGNTGGGQQGQGGGQPKPQVVPKPVVQAVTQPPVYDDAQNITGGQKITLFEDLKVLDAASKVAGATAEETQALANLYAAARKVVVENGTHGDYKAAKTALNEASKKAQDGWKARIKEIQAQVGQIEKSKRFTGVTEKEKAILTAAKTDLIAVVNKSNRAAAELALVTFKNKATEIADEIDDRNNQIEKGIVELGSDQTLKVKPHGSNTNFRIHKSSTHEAKVNDLVKFTFVPDGNYQSAIILEQIGVVPALPSFIDEIDLATVKVKAVGQRATVHEYPTVQAIQEQIRKFTKPEGQFVANGTYNYWVPSHSNKTGNRKHGSLLFDYDPDSKTIQVYHAMDGKSG